MIIMKTILKYSAVTLLAAAIGVMPAQLLAQNTNKAAAEKKAAVDKKANPEKKEAGKEEKKAGGHPFHGKLAAVDQVAKTITVGKSTYLITSDTKIKKAGKPATLADGVVGEEVGGYVKPNEQGKMVATTLNFGPKPEGKGPEKKKAGAEKQ
jgi:hypothetical protein